MNPDIMLKLSYLVVLIGTIAVAIGGYGIYYFKDKIEKYKPKLESQVIESFVDSSIKNNAMEVKNIIGDNNKIEQVKEKVMINTVKGDFVQGDKNVTINESPMEKINSVLIELRATCSLKKGVNAPPGEYTFISVGDANSYFINPSGKFKIEFLSPIKFRQLENGNIVIINRFITNNASDLLNRPISFLSTFDTLNVPIITVIYGKDFEKLYSVELALRVNDEDLWYESWKYNIDFQSATLQIPLDNLKLKLKEK